MEARHLYMRLGAPCCLSALVVAQQAAIDTRRLVDELRDDAWMARPDAPAWTLHGSSSTDPAAKDDRYANADAGHVLRVLEREGRREGVLVDARGPGALVRLWSANPKGVVRIEVDGLRVLELPFEQLLSGGGPAPAFLPHPLRGSLSSAGLRPPRTCAPAGSEPSKPSPAGPQSGRPAARQGRVLAP